MIKKKKKRCSRKTATDLKNNLTKIKGNAERERDRQTDRQTDRQAGRQAGRQTETDRDCEVARVK